MTFPLQILSLELDSSHNAVGMRDTLTLNIERTNISNDIIFNVYDSVEDIEYDLMQMQNISMITDSLGIINYEGDALKRYQDYGNPRYFLSISFLNLVEYSDDILSLSYQLLQNYPNPFNPVTRIEYDLPRVELVSLKIFDIMGREVKSLVDKTQRPGRQFALWDATNNLDELVSAGMYIYTIQAGKFRQTKKMLLLK